jgi:hypothetical protein
MPPKLRVPKARRLFRPEALALFAELEQTRGGSKSFQRGKSQELAAMLNLSAEWWSGCHVGDRSRAPCYPPSCAAFTDWHVCRAMREKLLEAAAEAGLLKGQEARRPVEKARP